jgi:hypothetical protein
MHLYSAISLLILGTGSYMAWAAWDCERRG